ncbi:MAG: HEPN domain-containing protein [Deltaproteobacteria bacterium]|jgi:HEPN domain-containing protein
MNNRESSAELLKGAERYLGFLMDAYRRREWNIAVRTGQDVVELALKALLKRIGIEYPKVHDVGRYVGGVLRRKKH